MVGGGGWIYVGDVFFLRKWGGVNEGGIGECPRDNANKDVEGHGGGEMLVKEDGRL